MPDTTLPGLEHSHPNTDPVAPIRHPYAWAAHSSRGARPTRCRTCKAFTLTGLDSDMCAFTTEVDPISLTVIGVAYAWLTNRRTYTARISNSSIILTIQDRWALRAGTPKYDVLAEHRCHTPIPEQFRTPSRIKSPATTQPAPDAPPPF